MGHLQEASPDELLEPTLDNYLNEQDEFIGVGLLEYCGLLNERNLKMVH
jgi:hypothetical protein